MSLFIHFPEGNRNVAALILQMGLRRVELKYRFLDLLLIRLNLAIAIVVVGNRLVDFNLFHGTRSFSPVIEFVAHTVFDVVVDDEVQFLFRETVMLCEECVDFVDDGLGKLDSE